MGASKEESTCTLGNFQLMFGEFRKTAHKSTQLCGRLQPYNTEGAGGYVHACYVMAQPAMYEQMVFPTRFVWAYGGKQVRP